MIPFSIIQKTMKSFGLLINFTMKLINSARNILCKKSTLTFLINSTKNSSKLSTRTLVFGLQESRSLQSELQSLTFLFKFREISRKWRRRKLNTISK
jgi:hypothetical protein